MYDYKAVRAAKVRAARLGHKNVVVTAGPTGYRCSCACGYRSTWVALQAHAVGAAVHHVQLVASGAWNRPKFPGGPTHAEALRRDLAGRAKVEERRTRARLNSDTPPADLAG